MHGERAALLASCGLVSWLRKNTLPKLATAVTLPRGHLLRRRRGLLGAQIVGIICIALWVGGLLGLFFLALKKVNMLRTSPEEEQLGLDESKHGGSAYNMELVAPMPAEV